MSLHDLRCMYSGVSLLGAETMLVLTASAFDAQEGAPTQPIALPLWGHYAGTSALADVSEGPNAQLIVSAWNEALLDRSLLVDFQRLGVEPCEFEHIETVLAIVAMNQLHQLDAVRWLGCSVGFSLLEANVAAALMQGEPERLVHIDVDDLAGAVLPHPVATAIYGGLRRQGPSVRCKFGLSFVSMASLETHLQAEGLTFSPPSSGIAAELSDASAYLAEALARFADNEALLEALTEYASDDELEGDDLEQA